MRSIYPICLTILLIFTKCKKFPEIQLRYDGIKAENEYDWDKRYGEDKVRINMSLFISSTVPLTLPSDSLGYAEWQMDCTISKRDIPNKPYTYRWSVVCWDCHGHVSIEKEDVFLYKYEIETSIHKNFNLTSSSYNNDHFSKNELEKLKRNIIGDSECSIRYVRMLGSHKTLEPFYVPKEDLLMVLKDAQRKLEGND